MALNLVHKKKEQIGTSCALFAQRSGPVCDVSACPFFTTGQTPDGF